MSELERRIRGGKVRWVARYFDPDGRRRGKVFDLGMVRSVFRRRSKRRRSPALSAIRPAARSQAAVGGQVAGDTRALEAVHTGSIPGHCVQAH